MAGTYCIMDGVEIPEEREHRRAVTCSDECKRKLEEHRRKRKDLKVCRMCFRPSTPEQRKMYQRWRRETFPPAKKGRPPIKKPEAAPALLDAQPMLVASEPEPSNLDG